MAAKLDDLIEFSNALSRAGVNHALGGSGLMRLAGIAVLVHDWDITTRARESQVTPVLVQYHHQRLPQIMPYCSRWAYRITVGGSDIDLIGDFAVTDGEEIVSCDTVVTGNRHGVPLGSLSEWEKVYRALGHAAKVALIARM